MYPTYQLFYVSIDSGLIEAGDHFAGDRYAAINARDTQRRYNAEDGKSGILDVIVLKVNTYIELGRKLAFSDLDTITKEKQTKDLSLSELHVLICPRLKNWNPGCGLELARGYSEEGKLFILEMWGPDKYSINGYSGYFPTLEEAERILLATLLNN